MECGTICVVRPSFCDFLVEKRNTSFFSFVYEKIHNVLVWGRPWTSCMISYITQRREQIQSKCIRSYSSVQHTTFSAAERMSGSPRGLHVDRRATNRRDKYVCRHTAITRIRPTPLLKDEYASSSFKASCVCMTFLGHFCGTDVVGHSFASRSCVIDWSRSLSTRFCIWKLCTTVARSSRKAFSLIYTTAPQCSLDWLVGKVFMGFYGPRGSIFSFMRRW